MTAINERVSLDRQGRIAVLTIDNPPVNALGQAVRAGMRDGVAAALADAGVDAVVITCAGRTFIAGADIAELERAAWRDGVGPDMHPLLAQVGV